MQTRRMVMIGTAGLAVAACAKPCPPIPVMAAPDLASLIDAHCHLFNAKDLSVVTFLTIVVAEQYPELGRHGLLDPDDPTVFDRFVRIILAIAGVDRAPSARHELEVLAGRGLTTPWGEEDDEPRQLVDDRAMAEARLADFLGGREFGRDGGIAFSGDQWSEVEEQLKRLVLDAADERTLSPYNEATRLDRGRRLDIARRALALDGPNLIAEEGDAFYLPGFFDFVIQSKRFRHCLVDELTKVHRSSGLEPALLSPAMVDFGRWLGEDPEKNSSFEDQVEVWARIATRPDGPAVHGYVAFCPLRQVLFDKERLNGTACNANPLKLVETALRTKGFLGVKVYPPMGFRAWDNASRAIEGPGYSLDVMYRVFGDRSNSREQRVELSQLLDKALKDLYALCGRPDIRAPIMAHGGDSINANVGMGKLADPWFWRGAFDWEGDERGRVQAPPIMLAHYGGFSYQSADPYRDPRPSPGEGTVPFRQTWEAALGRYINQNDGKPVFADISMLLGAIVPAQPKLKDNLVAWKALCPTIEDHLIFGTDWLMLAQKRGVDHYSRDVRNLLSEAFGAQAVPKIMGLNFLRYSGLSNEATQRRLATVYEGDSRLISRLARVSSSNF